MSSVGSSPDVIVVGAGAVGAAAGYALARRGAKVTILERSETLSGCSYGNAGLICPSHAVSLASLAAIRDGLRWMARRDSPFYLRPRPRLMPWLARFVLASRPSRSMPATASLRALADASLELHEQLAALGLETGFARRGILSVFESERLFESARTRLVGSPDGHVMTLTEAREIEPALSQQISGAVLYPREAHCDPGAFVSALLAAARDHGAELRTGVEVRRIRRTNGAVSQLETTAGTFAVGTLLVAAGTWTAQLARQIGTYVPLQPAKGYHVEIDANGKQVGLPIYMEDARVIATPLGKRIRFAGTLELSGDGAELDPVRVQALRRAGARVLDLAPSAGDVQVWQGLRPCTPDGLPVIGWADGIDNMLLATGHAMLGITLAPVTGEIVASLVCGDQPRHDLEALSPARFRTFRDLVGGGR
jgi:D-amino-acid dehydrogenase